MLEYLCGTIDHEIYYQRRVGPDRVLVVNVFVDLDWVGDLDHRISIGWYVFNLFGGAISWMRMKEDVMVLSSNL